MTRQCTEQTIDGLATYHEPTFRTYAPKWVTTDNPGEEVLIQLCETYECGRWESFYTDRARRIDGQRVPRTRNGR
jgi:hypothetical protein